MLQYGVFFFGFLLLVVFVLARIIKSVVTGRVPVTLGVEKYPRKILKHAESGPSKYHIIAEANGTNRTSATKNKNETGSQCMCVLDPYWYMRSRLAAETDYTACHQGK